MRSITEFLLSGKIGKTNGRRIIKALLYVSVLIAVLVVIYELAYILIPRPQFRCSSGLRPRLP